jgi:hypothetical protein
MSAEVTRETVLRLSELVGIRIAREHRAGVIRNLEIVLAQAAILERAELDPVTAPASVFRP